MRHRARRFRVALVRCDCRPVQVQSRRDAPLPRCGGNPRLASTGSKGSSERMLPLPAPAYDRDSSVGVRLRRRQSCRTRETCPARGPGSRWTRRRRSGNLRSARHACCGRGVTRKEPPFDPHFRARDTLRAERRVGFGDIRPDSKWPIQFVQRRSTGCALHVGAHACRRVGWPPDKSDVGAE